MRLRQTRLILQAEGTELSPLSAHLIAVTLLQTPVPILSTVAYLKTMPNVL